MLKRLLNMFLFIVSCLTIIVILVSPMSIFHSEKLSTLRSKMYNQDIAKQRLYISAWRITKSIYFDETMNHQDWNRWKYKYGSKIKTNEDVVVAINTMLASLNDKYSSFFDEKKYGLQTSYVQNYEDNDESLKTRFIKYLGKKFNVNEKTSKKNILTKLVNIKKPATVKIETIAGLVTKLTVVSESIYLKSLKKGDEIISINNYKVEGLECNSAIELLRGNYSYLSNFEIIRNGKIINVSVPRGTVTIEKINYSMLKNNILYIKVFTLMGNKTPIKFYNQINKNYSQTKGYIIDLRGDIGGQAINSVYMVDNLLNKGQEIMTIKYRNGSTITMHAETDAQIKDKPIVILINNQTASASEIFAGSLQQNKKAIIVGEESYGKNAIQQVIPMQNFTGISITTAYYSFDKNFDKKNYKLQPDYNVKLSQKAFLKGRDSQLEKAIQIIEEKTKNK